MAKGILGKKIGMTQIFSEKGKLIPVTVIEAEPNIVMQIKTEKSDGYRAVQLGFDEKKEKRASKSEIKHAGNVGTTPKKFVREIIGDEMAVFNPGGEVKVNIFKEGEIVDVTGIGKGKGYTGVIKRYNFHIGPKAHGSGYHRGIGSMGSIDAARVKKGKKMPGRMGGERVTVQNLEIVKVDPERNVILIRGNVPGAKRSYVMITNGVKAGVQPINPEALTGEERKDADR